MKNNIREELETKYLKEELVNDNTLLLYEQIDKDDILVKMRFIDHSSVKEYYVTHLTEKEFLEGDRIRINDDNTALAVFVKENDKEVLDNFLDLETHSSVGYDFIDCAYNMKFHDKVNDVLILVKN